MRNVFTGLFLASIGLVISPVFIFEHIRLLSIGAVFVLLVKALLISLVVYYFRYSWNTALAVGFSLAQVSACMIFDGSTAADKETPDRVETLSFIVQIQPHPGHMPPGCNYQTLVRAA